MLTSDLYQFLKTNKFTPPKSEKWPTRLLLSDRFWDAIIALHGLTLSEKREYALSVLSIEDRLYTGRPMSGEQSQIQIQHSFGKKYSQEKSGEIFKEVFLDGEVVDKYRIDRSEITKTVTGGLLFNLHTHPEHLDIQGKPTHSFFSVQDMLTFINSKNLVMGLVTNKFWLVGKTDKTIKTIGEVGVKMLEKITNQAFINQSELDKVVINEMKNWRMAIYRSDFKRALERIV